MSISSLRTAVTTAGGTPMRRDTIGLLRELLTAKGTAPLYFDEITLLRQAVTAWGGTPASYARVPLLRQLLTAVGGTPGSYSADALWAAIAPLAISFLYSDASWKLALDFDSQMYGASGTSYQLTAFPGYTYTRTGTQGAVDAAGAVAFFAANVPPINNTGYHAFGAATNYLLNAGGSASLATQNVTTTATPYTLSFIGTGTVTLSGTSTAGPLVGTGANNRVKLSFTPTAGTLTLTVTGSVTYAGLIDGTIPDGGPIIATAGATASIGNNALRVTDNVADGDQLFWANLKAYDGGSGVGRRIVRWGSSLTGGDYVEFYLGTDNIIYLQVEKASPSTFITPVATANDTGDMTIIGLRSGANWRAGKIKGGVLTWGSAATAHAMPPGIDQARPGHLFNGSFPFGDVLNGVFRKTLTDTSDANILATVGSF